MKNSKLTNKHKNNLRTLGFRGSRERWPFGTRITFGSPFGSPFLLNPFVLNPFVDPLRRPNPPVVCPAGQRLQCVTDR